METPDALQTAIVATDDIKSQILSRPSTRRSSAGVSVRASIYLPREIKLPDPPLWKQVYNGFQMYLKTIPITPDNIKTMSFRQRLQFHLTQPRESFPGWIFHRTIFFLLLLDTMLMALETCDGPRFHSSQPSYQFLPNDSFFLSTELFFTVIYFLEFLLRNFSCKNQKLFWKLKTTWIECIAWLPYFLYQGSVMMNHGNESFDPIQTRASINWLRLARIVRIILLSHVFDGTNIMFRAIQQSVAPLKITFFFLITVVMVFATAIFYAEPCYDLRTCTFTDIFNAGYFVMVTVATVGYGSQVPHNGYSMLLTSIVMIFGSLYLAMPLAIIGIRYEGAWREYEGSQRTVTSRSPSGRASFVAAMEDDLSLQPFESHQVYTVSHSICDHFYEISQRIGNVDVLIQRVIKDPERIKIRNETTIKIFEAVMGILKVHKKVCKEIRMYLPSTASTYKLKSMVEQPTQVQSIRVSSNIGSNKYTSNMVNRLRSAMSRTSSRRLQHTGPPTWRSNLWDILQHQSQTLFYAQTMPELQETGLKSKLCHRSIQDFCSQKSVGFYDQPGCFVFDDQHQVTTTRLNFQCQNSPECYGYGNNYGSDTFTSTCSKVFGKKGEQRVCNSRLCKPPVAFWLNMEPIWIYFECIINLIFTLEMIVRVIVHPQRLIVWKDLGFILDILVLLPFYSEGIEILSGRMPIYSVVPTTPSFSTLIRVLKTFRILKLGPYIAGSEVLTRTAFLVYKRLMIPIFFLFIGCVICGAVFYELERGTECFIGHQCMYWGKSILTPQLAGDLPLGKRILIQINQLSTIVDMPRSTWFSLVTITTVGYGDLVPRTPFGRIFDIFTMIMSACYTAMPLTLVGGQFYVCYEVYVRNQKRNAVRGQIKANPKETLPATEGLSVSVSGIILEENKPIAPNEPIVTPPASSIQRRPEISATEMQILNQFMLMHKVLSQVIEDLSRLNQMGTRDGMEKRTQSSEKIQTEEQIEQLIAENMGFCVTVFLNFAPIIEKLVGIQSDHPHRSSKILSALHLGES